MGVLLLTILGDIIAGLTVHGITKGYSRSEGNQTVIIENAFFNVPEIRFSSSSSGSSSDNKLLEWILTIIFIFALIVVAIVGLSAIYVKNINIILGSSFYITIGLIVIGTILLIIGILQGINIKDWSVAQVAFYSLILTGFVGGLVWLIYDHPNAPSGYMEAFIALQNLDFQDSEWISRAMELGMGDEFLTINPIITFLALQAIGILPMVITIVLVIIIQLSLANAVLTNEKGVFSFWALISAPIAASISALFLGIF